MGRGVRRAKYLEKFIYFNPFHTNPKYSIISAESFHGDENKVWLVRIRNIKKLSNQVPNR